MRATRIAVALVAVALVSIAMESASGAAPKTRLVSKNSAGEPGDDFSVEADLSRTGRYVSFQSVADNFPGTDGESSIYVRDRRTGKTRLVSKTSSGEPTEGGQSRDASISGDGRFIAFESLAENLPAGGDPWFHIYVHDRTTGRTRLISKTSSGTPANDHGTDSSISASGRFVVFRSMATNLPAGSATTLHVYIHDRKTKTTRLVSKSSAGEAVMGVQPDVSGNGRFVSFLSNDSALPGATPGVFHAYVRDRETGKTRLVSKAPGGQPFAFSSQLPAISTNGRVVAFHVNIEVQEVCEVQRVYAHDRKTGRTRLVSKTSGGEPASGCSANSHVSATGRFIAFTSDADNLPGPATFFGVYMHDRRRGTTQLMSRNSSGEPVIGGGGALTASADWISFISSDDNLPAGGSPADVYIRGPLR